MSTTRLMRTHTVLRICERDRTSPRAGRHPRVAPSSRNRRARLAPTSPIPSLNGRLVLDALAGPERPPRAATRPRRRARAWRGPARSRGIVTPGAPESRPQVPVTRPLTPTPQPFSRSTERKLAYWNFRGRDIFSTGPMTPSARTFARVPVHSMSAAIASTVVRRQHAAR